MDIFGQNIKSDSLICKPIIDSLTQVEYFLFVDSMPEYPGGKAEMLSFFSKNFRYPTQEDIICKIFVEFIIDKKGKMTNLKIIRGFHEDFDNETLRIMRLMPDWKAGKCDGTNVNVKVILPWSIGLQ